MTIPRPLAWLWEGWKRVSHAIGLAVSVVVLALFWLVVIGCYAIVFRIIRLFQKTETPASYWRDLAPENSESLLHPF
ncbi:MAG TPA: hypothetical protein DEB30_04565 [Candidatus Peribacter riflensis]|uniref:Uncharacterized protein n=1 Tax=Candidatus Peribacter riflensis TaxID=1735162 RepID=A0A0S1SRC5_9BACT|nr:MAG: hypothetical protein PeribacterA2_0868 [Candidatus Peribacter riflensis]OGJ79173.1 MAG: hypothetical protein A2398_03285 [Candidatus Peribacteria bacterium RIFOXYB1_FULL_57_12]OGJ79688.1 MAG: hypothetical protein A2412_01935 [Candidatus Peribacteria bacterium RIFOXYC1_FULL_58_8]ALM11333.1 MAG: hypothetical protein PeribacterB2_0870 [Candidatus Peribacter riflensis]ALM12435.1 MAG: hypothetical protein PeribacterC2_0869 [Candidatus Peribacter riflensis]